MPNYLWNPDHSVITDAGLTMLNTLNPTGQGFTIYKVEVGEGFIDTDIVAGLKALTDLSTTYLVGATPTPANFISNLAGSNGLTALPRRISEDGLEGSMLSVIFTNDWSQAYATFTLRQVGVYVSAVNYDGGNGVGNPFLYMVAQTTVDTIEAVEYTAEIFTKKATNDIMVRKEFNFYLQHDRATNITLNVIGNYTDYALQETLVALDGIVDDHITYLGNPHQLKRRNIGLGVGGIPFIDATYIGNSDVAIRKAISGVTAGYDYTTPQNVIDMITARLPMPISISVCYGDFPSSELRTCDGNGIANQKFVLEYRDDDAFTNTFKIPCVVYSQSTIKTNANTLAFGNGVNDFLYLVNTSGVYSIYGFNIPSKTIPFSKASITATAKFSATADEGDSLFLQINHLSNGSYRLLARQAFTYPDGAANPFSSYVNASASTPVLAGDKIYFSVYRRRVQNLGAEEIRLDNIQFTLDLI